MISASTSAKNVLSQSVSVQSGSGCIIEYNLNSMVDNITVSGNDYVKSDGSTPFKKLFPISSIIKPFRPVGAGVKYAIAGDVSSNSYQNPKATTYPLNYRTYYPGVDTYYKYWISPKGVGADISVTYPQTILTNKLVIKFEISHSVPSTWTVYANSSQIATGSNSAIKAFGSGYEAGSLILYYNGSSWSTTEPSSPATPTSITSLRLTTSAVSNAYVAVTEISPRWYSDISSSLQSFSISKESSTSADDILPVGKVSANSLNANFISYESTRKMISYTKNSAFDSSKIYLYKQAEIKPYYKIYYTGAPLSDSRGAYEKITQGTFYIDSWSASEYGDISINALDGAKVLQEIIAPGIVCEDYSAVAIIRRLLDNIGFTNYNINVKKTGSSITDTSIFSPKFWWTDDSKTVWAAIQELCRDSQMVASFDENNILQFYTRDYLFGQTEVNWPLRYDADGTNLPNIVTFDKQDLATANQIKVLWNSVTTSKFDGNSQPLWKSDTTFIGAFSLEEDLSATAGPGDYIRLSAVNVNNKEKQVLYSYSGYLAINSEIIEYDAIEYMYLDKTGTIKYTYITNISDLQKIQGDIATNYSIDQVFIQSGKVRIKQRGAFGTGPNGQTGTGVAHLTGRTSVLTSWNGKDVVLSPVEGTAVTPSSTASNIVSVTTTPSLLSSPVESTKDVKQVQRSLLQLTCNSSNANLYSMAIKNTGIASSGSNYLFGSGVFFQNIVKDVPASGGIGFFTSSDGLDGYYVMLRTTSSIDTAGKDKEVAIYKAVDGKLTKLTDTQKDETNSINYITGATMYKLDVRVKTENSVVVIDVYVNNFKITAVDTSKPGSTNPMENVLPATSNVALVSTTGSTFFDYVYAMPVTEEQYNTGPLQDIYNGQYGSATLNFLFGERVVSNLGKSSLPNGFVEEFGTVARELRKATIKYDSRPGYPLYPSLGISKYVEVLGSRLTSFGAEIYLLNNAGTFMPLDDAQLSSFSIIGSYVVQSGQHEYMDSTINEFSAPEPVVFESTWIQTESDAKALSDWIKNQWSKKQVVCTLNIFGNPLISVGDIVTINYPANNLDGTQKFIVVNVNNDFTEGVDTNITVRSIYS